MPIPPHGKLISFLLPTQGHNPYDFYLCLLCHHFFAFTRLYPLVYTPAFSPYLKKRKKKRELSLTPFFCSNNKLLAVSKFSPFLHFQRLQSGLPHQGSESGCLGPCDYRVAKVSGQFSGLTLLAQLATCGAIDHSPQVLSAFGLQDVAFFWFLPSPWGIFLMKKM